MCVSVFIYIHLSIWSGVCHEVSIDWRTKEKNWSFQPALTEGPPRNKTICTTDKKNIKKRERERRLPGN